MATLLACLHIQELHGNSVIHLELCFSPPDECKANIHPLLAPFWSLPTPEELVGFTMFTSESPGRSALPLGAERTVGFFPSEAVTVELNFSDLFRLTASNCKLLSFTSTPVICINGICFNYNLSLNITYKLYSAFSQYISCHFRTAGSHFVYSGPPNGPEH